MFDKSNFKNARWKDGVTQDFEVNLKIVAKDTIGLASRMLGLISTLGVDITKIFAKQRGVECEFKLTLKLKTTKDLDKITEKLLQITEIKSINRSFD